MEKSICDHTHIVREKVMYKVLNENIAVLVPKEDFYLWFLIITHVSYHLMQYSMLCRIFVTLQNFIVIREYLQPQYLHLQSISSCETGFRCLICLLNFFSYGSK
jgi:hypothetical protein